MVAMFRWTIVVERTDHWRAGCRRAALLMNDAMIVVVVECSGDNEDEGEKRKVRASLVYVH